MSKLYIMYGLPGSGKSTYSKYMVQKPRTVRLNRDLLREMLHFSVWSPLNEKLTIQAQENLASYFLQQNYNVIIDDTNLNPEILEKWKHFTQDWEVIDLSNVSVKTCIQRDKLREKPVGEKVIKDFASKYL